MSWKRSVSEYVKEIVKYRGHPKAIALVMVGILTIILGYVGFRFPGQLPPGNRSYLDILYRVCELFTFKGSGDVVPGNLALELARWIAPAITLFALYEFIKTLLTEQIQSFRLQSVRSHVVVCGLGLLGPEITARFREQGFPVVVIEKNPENPNLAACRELGAIIIIGDATTNVMLKKARVSRARYLFAVTGDDGQNSEIAVAAHRMVDEGGSGCLTCFIHIVACDLCTLLREHQIAVDNDRFMLELFNIYQMAGLSVQEGHPPFLVQPTPPDAHLLIVGAGRMGRSLIFHAVRRWRETYGNVKKIRITVIDSKANEKVEVLKIQYPSIANYCDLQSVPANLNSLEFQRGQFLFEDDRVSVTAVYICMNDQSLGLAAALEINQRLRDFAIRRHVEMTDVPIVIRTGKEGLTKLFNDMRGTSGSFRNLDSFPLFDQSQSLDIITGGLNETIARAIHDNYVQKQLEEGEMPEENPSIKPWEKLEETLRESNRNQAVHIRGKLYSIGCDIAGLTDWEEEPFRFEAPEIEMLAEVEHKRFVEERLRQGWVPGEVKDIEKKISPYLVDYDKLPENVKDLDRNAIRALPSVLARADLKIIRLPGTPGHGDCRMEKEIACKT